MVFGPNAAGKTSLLEAIYMLATGRSFRTHRASEAIRYETDQLDLAGDLETTKGDSLHFRVSRHRSGRLRATANDERVDAVSELAAWLPLQLMSPQSATLPVGNPEQRRGFVDAGLFYTNPHFRHDWNQYRHYLRQRNSALKQPVLSDDLAVWEQGMAQAGCRVSRLRTQYAADLEPLFRRYGHDLLREQSAKVEFVQGWPKADSLLDVLVAGRAQDHRLGYSRQGPHRADLALTIKGRPARELLSGGQAKLMACALQLAQAHLLWERYQRQSIFLIDDLAAELDEEHFERVLGALCALEAQAILTALDSVVARRIEAIVEKIHSNISVGIFHIAEGQLSIWPAPEKRAGDA